MSHNTLISKNNIDAIFEFLSQEYELLGGTQKIDIFLVGGAAIVLNFNYRLSTIDIDAYYKTNEAFKEATKITSQKFQLPSDWLNSDFVNTPSYSKEIIKKSKLFKSFNNLITINTLEPNYLIAMKLKSSRPTAGDLEDIIMMIYELRYKQIPISFNDIMNAYNELYSDFSNTLDYFIKETKKALEAPLEDFKHFFTKSVFDI